MPTPISKKNVSEVFLGGTTLQLMPSDLSEIVPENAHASFYTYRNIVPDATPDANTPYIRIKTLFNGIMTRSEKNMDEFLYEHLTSGYRSALPELLEKYPEYFCV